MANNTISQQVFDQRNQAVKTAEANVLSAEASVRSAELDVEFTQIHAPITGRISRKLISEGNYITGGSGSGTLAHHHRLDRSDLLLFRYQRG